MLRRKVLELSTRGFLLVPAVLEAAALAELRAAVDALPPGGGGNLLDEALQSHPAVARLSASDLFARAAEEIFASRPRTMEVAARAPRSGLGQQGLHCDVATREGRAMTALVYLDDADAQNGGTRIVPGTHLRRSMPPRRLADPAAHHPEEQIIAAAAGTALIFDGHLWHSGTRNSSGRPRRALQICWR
jgi:ectoine hydroxylase-related dioxygenase (phytanoyl-CoA dioxygenase family)